MTRVAAGVDKFVIRARQPFLVMSIDHQSSGPGAAVRGANEPLSTITGKARHALIAPTLIQTGYGEREGQAPRVPGLDKPLGTVMATGQKHALVAAFLAKHYTGIVGTDLRQPIGTVTAVDHHSLVQAFLIAYYTGGGQLRSLHDPLGAVVSRERFGLVQVHGEPHYIADIGLRMLTPRELFRAQGFPEDVQLVGNQREQVERCGNSVCPPMAEALVRANLDPLAEPARRAA